MTSVVLKTGEVAVVDDEDAARVNQFQWYLHVKGYACAFQGRQVIYMHRLVLNAPKGVQVDHRNRAEKLDNRKQNLRLATGTQNQGNKAKQPGKSSQFKGVSWSKARSKWIATIGRRINGTLKTKYLGLFSDEADAARAYNAAAIGQFGEYALLNHGV